MFFDTIGSGDRGSGFGFGSGSGIDSGLIMKPDFDDNGT